MQLAIRRKAILSLFGVYLPHFNGCTDQIELHSDAFDDRRHGPLFNVDRVRNEYDSSSKEYTIQQTWVNYFEM